MFCGILVSEFDGVALDRILFSEISTITQLDELIDMNKCTPLSFGWY